MLNCGLAGYDAVGDANESGGGLDNARHCESATTAMLVQQQGVLKACLRTYLRRPEQDGVTRVTLCARKGNKAAIRVYEDGLKFVYCRQDVYPDGDVCLVFKLELEHLATLRGDPDAP